MAPLQLPNSPCKNSRRHRNCGRTRVRLGVICFGEICRFGLPYSVPKVHICVKCSNKILSGTHGASATIRHGSVGDGTGPKHQFGQGNLEAACRDLIVCHSSDQPPTPLGADPYRFSQCRYLRRTIPPKRCIGMDLGPVATNNLEPDTSMLTARDPF